MLTAPLWSRIIVRPPNRAVLRVRLGSARVARRWLAGVRETLGPVGHVDEARVAFEGEAAPRVAAAIGWPKEVVRALERLVGLRGEPGLPLPVDVLRAREEAAGELRRCVERAERRALAGRRL